MKRLKGYGIALATSAAIAAAALSTAGAAAAAPMPPVPNPVSHAATPSALHSMPYQPAGLNPDERAAVATSHHRLHRLRNHRR